MTNNGIVNIHGKDYMTVARRVELAHKDKVLESVETEVVSHNPVVVKAKISVKGKIFTGVSSVNLDSGKQIERQNPYEVAETSAVGRALGFAGYGLLEGIASADEMVKAQDAARAEELMQKQKILTRKLSMESVISDLRCEVCGAKALERKGVTRGGRPYHGIFCSTEDKSHTKWIWN